ncbi:MAG: hypothetical protein JXR83_04645 [Deltaproteobacteria bacterium]|nr:hypothetical protein [Deltaproteobacteria bacterium]
MLLVAALALSQATAAQPVGAAAIQQSEARLSELDLAIGELQSQQARLLDEAKDLRAQIDKVKASGNSALVKSEHRRLLRKAALLEQRRRALGSKLDELEQQRRAIAGSIGPRPASVRRQIEDTARAEAVLRHKARLVAAKIRQLRQQQRLAGDVMRTVREQALFDEEERQLSVSRVVSKTSGTPAAVVPSQHAVPAAGGGGQTDTPPGEYGGGSNTNADPTTADDLNGSTSLVDGDSRSWETSAAGECSGGVCGAPSPADGTGGVSMSYSVVSGNRLNTLLDQNVETLLGDNAALDALAGSPEELRQLEALRVELLRNADELARKRTRLEVEARSTPR